MSKLRVSSRTGFALGVVGFGLGVGVLVAVGCTSSSLFQNLVAPRSGNITLVFINDTPYRAVFSFGTFDDLDRTPGAINFDQLRLEGRTTSEAVELPCARNAAVGTQKLVTRVLETNADETAEDFDPDAFSPQVGFSRFPAGSSGEGLADAGYADGREVLLGVDYTCGDQLFFTFVEDETAAGGFRIDFTVVQDTDE